MMSIALKEAYETEYWLLLLRQTDYIDEPAFESIHHDVVKLLKLTSIVNSAKRS